MIKKFNTIFNLIVKNNKRHYELSNKLSFNFSDMSHDEIISGYTEKRRLELEAAILKNNARYALFNEIKPALLDVLKKYEGKKAGEATREKITADFKELTGCKMYFSSASYANYANIIIYPLDSSGHYRSGFGLDLELTGKYLENKHFSFLENNAVIFPKSEDLFYCIDCHNYIDNIPGHIKKLEKAAADYDKKLAELREAQKIHSALCVAGIDHKKYF